MEGLRTARIRDILRPETTSESYDHLIAVKLLIYSVLFKLLLALSIPIALDEAYSTAVAREFSLSFFEHPPVSFWLPVLAAKLTGIEATIIYRLPFLLIGFGTSWVMYLIGREVGGSRVGLWSMLLFLAAPFFLLSSGVFAVPDGPLCFASAIVVLNLMRIAKCDGSAPLRLWLDAGLAMALALGSKYQAAWLPVAVFLFMLLSPRGRKWFARPGLYVAGLIGLLGLAPVVLWNIQTDWVTLKFHTARVSGGLHFGNFFSMLVAQAVFLLPASGIMALIGLKLAAMSRRNDPVFLLGLLAIGPILVFNYINLTSAQSHAHWSMPGWQFALPLAAIWINGCSVATLKRIWTWTAGWFLGLWILLGLLILHSTTGLLTRPFYDRAPAWDNTISLFDFGQLKSELKHRGLWDKTDLFMANSWAYGGILDTAMASEKPMRIFDQEAAHHFPLLSDAAATGVALFMEPQLLGDTDAATVQVLASARTLDPLAELLPPLVLRRGGLPYVNVILVRLTLR